MKTMLRLFLPLCLFVSTANTIVSFAPRSSFQSIARRGAFIRKKPQLYAFQELDSEKIGHIIDGAAFLAAGGGGPKSMGKQILEKKLASSKVLMAELSDVHDNDMVVVSAYLGSPAAALGCTDMEYESLTRSVKVLAERQNATIDYVLPVEIGAVNSITPMVVANDLNIPVVDADGAGRAVPTIACCTFGADDTLLSNGCAVANDDPNSEQYAFFKVDNASLAEKTAAAIVQLYGNLGALAIFLINGAQLKKTAIKGGLTRSLKLGKALAECKGDYAREIVKILAEMDIPSRIVVQNATIKSFVGHTVNSLDEEKIIMRDENGSIVTVSCLNENMFAFKSTSPTPLVMSPEMLCWILPDGTTLDNSELQSMVKNANASSPVVIQAIAVQPPKEMYKNKKIMDAFMSIFDNNFGYAGSFFTLWPEKEQNKK